MIKEGQKNELTWIANKGKKKKDEQDRRKGKSLDESESVIHILSGLS